MDGHSTAYFWHDAPSGSHHEMSGAAQDDAPTSTAPNDGAWSLGEPPLLACGAQDAATASWRRDLTTAWALNDLLTSKEFLAWLRTKNQGRASKWYAVVTTLLLVALASVPLMASNPYLPRISVPACQQQPQLCNPAIILSKVPVLGHKLLCWLPTLISKPQAQHSHMLHNFTSTVPTGTTELSVELGVLDTSSCPAASMLQFSCCKECPDTWDDVRTETAQHSVHLQHEPENLELAQQPYQGESVHRHPVIVTPHLAQLMNSFALHEQCQKQLASLALLGPSKSLCILSCHLFEVAAHMSTWSDGKAHDEQRLPDEPRLPEAADDTPTATLAASEQPQASPATAPLSTRDVTPVPVPTSHPQWFDGHPAASFLCGFVVCALFCASAISLRTWLHPRPVNLAVQSVSPLAQSARGTPQSYSASSGTRSGPNLSAHNSRCSGGSTHGGSDAWATRLLLSPLKPLIPTHLTPRWTSRSAATSPGSTDRNDDGHALGGTLLDQHAAMSPADSQTAGDDAPPPCDASTEAANHMRVQHDVGAQPHGVVLPTEPDINDNNVGVAAAGDVTPATGNLVDSPSSHGSFTFPLTQPSPSPPPVTRQPDSMQQSPSSGDRQARLSNGSSTASTTASSRPAHALCLRPGVSALAPVASEGNTEGTITANGVSGHQGTSSMSLHDRLPQCLRGEQAGPLHLPYNWPVSMSSGSDSLSSGPMVDAGTRNDGNLSDSSLPDTCSPVMPGLSAQQYSTPDQSSRGFDRLLAPTITPPALLSAMPSLPRPTLLSYGSHINSVPPVGLATGIFPRQSGTPRLSTGSTSSAGGISTTMSEQLPRAVARTLRPPTLSALPAPTSDVLPSIPSTTQFPAGVTHRMKGINALLGLRRRVHQDEVADMVALVTSLPEALTGSQGTATQQPQTNSMHGAVPSLMASAKSSGSVTASTTGRSTPSEIKAGAPAPVQGGLRRGGAASTMMGSSAFTPASTSTNSTSSTPFSMPAAAASWGSGNTTQTGSTWPDENAAPEAWSAHKAGNAITVGNVTVAPAVSSHLTAVASTCSMLADFHHMSRGRLLEVVAVLQSLVPATQAEFDCLRQEPEAAVQRMCAASQAAMQEVDATLGQLQADHQQGVDWLDGHLEHHLLALGTCLSHTVRAREAQAPASPLASTPAWGAATHGLVPSVTRSSSAAVQASSASPDIVKDNQVRVRHTTGDTQLPGRKERSRSIAAEKQHLPRKQQGAVPCKPALLLHGRQPSDDTQQQQDRGSTGCSKPASVAVAPAGSAASVSTGTTVASTLAMFPAKYDSNGGSSAAVVAHQQASDSSNSPPYPCESDMRTPDADSLLACHLVSTAHSVRTPHEGILWPGGSDGAWTTSTCMGRMVDSIPAAGNDSIGHGLGSNSNSVNATIADKSTGGVTSAGSSCRAVCSSLADDGSSLIDLAEADLIDDGNFLLPSMVDAGHNSIPAISSHPSSTGAASDVSSCSTGPRLRSVGHETPEASIMHACQGDVGEQEWEVPSTGAVFGHAADQQASPVTNKRGVSRVTSGSGKGQRQPAVNSEHQVETFLDLMEGAATQAPSETCWLTGSDGLEAWTGLDAPPCLPLETADHELGSTASDSTKAVTPRGYDITAQPESISANSVVRATSAATASIGGASSMSQPAAGGSLAATSSLPKPDTAVSSAYADMWRQAAMEVLSPHSTSTAVQDTAEPASTQFVPDQHIEFNVLQHVHLRSEPKQTLHSGEKLTVTTFGTSRSKLLAPWTKGALASDLGSMGNTNGTVGSSTGNSHAGSSGSDSRLTIISPSANPLLAKAGQYTPTSGSSPTIQAVLLPAGSAPLPMYSADYWSLGSVTGPQEHPHCLNADGVSFTTSTAAEVAAAGWASISPTSSSSLRTCTSLPANLLHRRTPSDTASEQQFIEDLVAEFVASADQPLSAGMLMPPSSAGVSSPQTAPLEPASGTLVSVPADLSAESSNCPDASSTTSTGSHTSIASASKSSSSSCHSMQRSIQRKLWGESSASPVQSASYSRPQPAFTFIPTVSEPSSPASPRSRNSSTTPPASPGHSETSKVSSGSMVGGHAPHDGLSLGAVSDDTPSIDTVILEGATGLRVVVPAVGSGGVIIGLPSPNRSSGYSQGMSGNGVTQLSLDSCLAQLEGGNNSSGSSNSSVAMQGAACNLATKLAAAAGNSDSSSISPTDAIGCFRDADPGSCGDAMRNGDGDTSTSSSSSSSSPETGVSATTGNANKASAEHDHTIGPDSCVAQLTEGNSSGASSVISMGSIKCDLAQRLAVADINSSGSVSSSAAIISTNAAAGADMGFGTDTSVAEAVRNEAAGMNSHEQALSQPQQRTMQRRIMIQQQSSPGKALAAGMRDVRGEGSSSGSTSGCGKATMLPLIGLAVQLGQGSEVQQAVRNEHASEQVTAGSGRSSNSMLLIPQSLRSSSGTQSPAHVSGAEGGHKIDGQSRTIRLSPLLRAVQSSSGEEDETSQVTLHAEDSRSSPSVLWSWRKRRAAPSDSEAAGSSSTPNTADSQ